VVVVVPGVTGTPSGIVAPKEASAIVPSKEIMAIVPLDTSTMVQTPAMVDECVVQSLVVKETEQVSNSLTPEEAVESGNNNDSTSKKDTQDYVNSCFADKAGLPMGQYMETTSHVVADPSPECKIVQAGPNNVVVKPDDPITFDCNVTTALFGDNSMPGFPPDRGESEPVDVVDGGGYKWGDSDSHHGNDSRMSEPQQFQAHAMPCPEGDMPVSVYVPFCVSFNTTKHGYVGSSLQLS